MAGRSGRRSSSHNTRQGPTPLTHIPASDAPAGVLAISAALIEHTSRHHMPSASTSAQPGRGKSIVCAIASEARTEPVVSTRTPFVLPVPMSIPSSKFTLQPYVERTAIRDSADSAVARRTCDGRSPILHRQVATLHRAVTGRGTRVEHMADVWVVLGVIGFVVAMLALIRGLERV